MKQSGEWLGVRATMNAQTDALFVSEQRQALNRATVNLVIGKSCRSGWVGSPGRAPHMLRHSTDYSLVNRGVDIRTVQEFLGHSRIENTVRYAALNHSRFARLF